MPKDAPLNSGARVSERLHMVTAMTPKVRKFALTMHIITSVGWLGAVAAFIALTVPLLTNQDPAVVRAVYVAMELIGWFLIVPLNFASLITGLVLSLGTRWGLFVHYWVLVKFLLNVFASIILLGFMLTLNDVAAVATRTRLSDTELSWLRSPSPLVHAGGALIILLVATVLSVYKPQGMTRYGRRKQQRQHEPSKEEPVRGVGGVRA